MEWIETLTGPFTLDTSTWWIALGSALALGFLLGALPLGAAEAVALAAGTIPSSSLRTAVVVLFTIGHLVGKAPWFVLGTLESRVTHVRLRAWIDRARAVARKYPTLGLGVTAASAVASVPPFHLVAVAAGLVHSRAVPFFAVSFAGRLTRFGALAAFPSMVEALLAAG